MLMYNKQILLYYHEKAVVTKSVWIFVKQIHYIAEKGGVGSV